MHLLSLHKNCSAPGRAAAGMICVVIITILFNTRVSEAGSWQGKEENKDGITHVMNPSEPYNGSFKAAPKLLWKISGDEDEFILGIITQIQIDNNGNVYLLDYQLNDIKVLSPSGGFLRSIGREGEGPGEFRRASGMFITPGGNIAVVQAMPGKIILLTPEGEPAGNMNVPQAEDRGMQMFASGSIAGDHIVLAVQRFKRGEASFDVISSLIGINDKGESIAEYVKQQRSRDMAKMVFDEKTSSISSLVWTAFGDGRVAASDDFDAFKIKVWAPNGEIEKIIEENYTHRQRSPEEIELFKPRVRIRSSNRQIKTEVHASKTDRDIVRIFPMGDGGFWVLSSKGAFDAQSTEIGAFDIFSKDGRLVSRVTIEGSGNFRQDGYHIVKDRLYVVKGMRSARMAMAGMGESNEEEKETEPMSVLCYDLEPVFDAIKLKD